MKSLKKGLDCLMLLERRGGILSVADVRGELGLPRSSAYRILAALADDGFLEPLESADSYGAGPALVTLSRTVLSSLDVHRFALGEMRALAARFPHSVYLMVRQGRDAVCIEKIDGSGGLQLNLAVGGRRPLHGSGIAKIFLSDMTDAELDDYVASDLESFTASTITDGNRLRESAREMRSAGYAVSTGEFVRGARSIGVPVYDHRGQIAASIGVGGSAQDLSDTATAAVVPALVAAAGRISARLGHLTGETEADGRGDRHADEVRPS